MNIVVDIGHPAHVHFFKNFIWEMQNRGHEILVTASDKDVTLSLLKSYGIPYVSMGNYGSGLFRKMVNIPFMDYKLWLSVRNFKPDIFIGISTIRSAHISKVMRKPCIVFDDTEHSKWEHILYKPFADVICTPSCFNKTINGKQVKYEGYHELAYLHPNYFHPDSSILKELGISEEDKFIVIRFVAWDAGHDAGQYGFNLEQKRKLVFELEKYAKIIITSEDTLPEEFNRFKITIGPENIHHLLYYASLYVGEGATMASECAVLGTPAIYVNTLSAGTLDEQEKKYGLIYCFKNQHESQDQPVQKAIELIQQNNFKQQYHSKRNKMLDDKIDVTRFIINLIENYPECLRKDKTNHH